jgi:hypothetical protein
MEENDAALAKSLDAKRASVRDRDAKGKKATKAKALASLREVSTVEMKWYLIDQFALSFCG